MATIEIGCRLYDPPVDCRLCLRKSHGAFHGDQHCAQGPIGIAAAVAIGEFLEKEGLPGTVTVFGTPAEELLEPSAKTTMHKSHVFDGMDVIVRSHASTNTSRPAPGFGIGTCCLNIDGVKYTFSGAPAHQMTAVVARDQSGTWRRSTLRR